MKLIEFAKLTGSLLVLFAIALQLGCDGTNEMSSEDPELESDVESDSENSVTAIPASPTAAASGYEFETPVRLMAGGEYVSVESPGYACPTMADVDQDGKLDLVVGQFSNGKMHFCKNIAKEGAPHEFAKSDWIKTESDPAQVPGVW